ncbi:ElaA protein [Virgibacillus subterraneus]|uniref:ElaA protein n=1 Tax=Virgibacillus subterraneus TaxID=621109 RepID=A0A1H9INE6_9BACI|nr:GNAT family N-acetyltransferase [Virgibacillus subterraneus]SEQ76271.1 ElaA protein [Virgibacillus subterraneus]
MEWSIKSFDELTNDELYGLLKLRVDIFVVEQDCPYPELDNYDQLALHFFLKINGEFAVNVRILPSNSKYVEVSIGRVSVAEKFRRQGYARQIMQNAIDYVLNEWNEKRIKVQGQEYLKDFYSGLGFEQVTESYLEDGIPHIDMIWEAK